MSYCRWSSDDFGCDVYVYESAEGFMTHVAGNRAVFKSELPPEISMMEDPHGWAERHGVVMEMVKDAERVDIGLPHDGETFVDDSPEACAARLKELKEMGYRVPQYAIDDLLAVDSGLG